MELPAAIRRVLAPLSPGRRRWNAFLHGLPLDVDALADPLTPTGPRDVIVCGCPRTGTTMLSAALFQPPRAISVMEPWDGMRMPPGELFGSLREEIGRGRLDRGRLDLDRYDAEHVAEWCGEGATGRAVEVDDDYLLAVKWVGWWRFLDRLPDTRFVVCLRDPAEVVASFRQLGGRVGMGLQYDTRFNRRLNDDLTKATDDLDLRRVLLWEYVHERLAPHLERENVFWFRYEWWFEDPEGAMERLGAFLGTDLEPAKLAIRRPRPPVLTPGEQAALSARSELAARFGYQV